MPGLLPDVVLQSFLSRAETDEKDQYNQTLYTFSSSHLFFSLLIPTNIHHSYVLHRLALHPWLWSF